MLDSLQIKGQKYDFDASDPIDISIPLRFDGPQPNAYGVAPATSTPCASGELTGDTRQGGSCNFEQYTFIPHCNGTHTECVGHITHERISVRDCLRDAFIQAVLISVEPEAVERATDTYAIQPRTDDSVITKGAIENALGKAGIGPQEAVPMASSALIVRTLPNTPDKLVRSYLMEVPPYFTTGAMETIVESGFEHLLVDLPSIDRLYDEGKLANHRMFWKIDQGSFELSEIARRRSTITEMIYIPNDVADGRYLLNLQIAPFASDASPCRPLLFRIL